MAEVEIRDADRVVGKTLLLCNGIKLELHFAEKHYTCLLKRPSQLTHWTSRNGINGDIPALCLPDSVT
jgi:hypothetical protein